MAQFCALEYSIADFRELSKLYYVLLLPQMVERVGSFEVGGAECVEFATVGSTQGPDRSAKGSWPPESAPPEGCCRARAAANPSVAGYRNVLAEDAAEGGAPARRAGPRAIDVIGDAT